MDTYDIGDVVRIEGEFKNPDGELTDPGTVSVTIKKPDGTELPTRVYNESTDDIQKDGVGRYRTDVDIPSVASSAGTWRYRWFSDGEGKAAEEGAFKIRRSKFIT